MSTNLWNTLYTNIQLKHPSVVQVQVKSKCKWVWSYLWWLSADRASGMWGLEPRDVTEKGEYRLNSKEISLQSWKILTCEASYGLRCRNNKFVIRSGKKYTNKEGWIILGMGKVIRDIFHNSKILRGLSRGSMGYWGPGIEFILRMHP